MGKGKLFKNKRGKKKEVALMKNTVVQIIFFYLPPEDAVMKNC